MKYRYQCQYCLYEFNTDDKSRKSTVGETWISYCPDCNQERVVIAI